MNAPPALEVTLAAIEAGASLTVGWASALPRL